MNTSLNEEISEDVEKKEFNHQIGVCRVIMKMYGLWIYKKNTAWVKALCNMQVSATFFYSIILGTVPCISALIKVWGNLILMLDNFMVTIPVICIDIKIATLWMRKRDLAKLFKVMAEDWCQKGTSDEKKIMKRNSIVSQFIVWMGLFTIFFNVAIIHTAIFFGKLVRTENNITDIPGYLLAMQTSYFYDITKGNRYILTRLSQLFSCLLGGFIYTLPDGLFGVLLLHTCAQMEIFSRRLKTIVKAPVLDFCALRSLVLKHYKIIRFVAVIEDIFTFLVLSLVVLFTVIFTVLAFQLMTALTNDAKISLIQTGFYLGYMMYFLFLMFIYSWVGQNLIDQCENLTRALYDCDWFSLPPNQSLQLMLILIRSQKPLVITVGKIAPLTLASFLQLMKTCAGYVSFLAAIKN